MSVKKTDWNSDMRAFGLAPSQELAISPNPVEKQARPPDDVQTAFDKYFENKKVEYKKSTGFFSRLTRFFRRLFYKKIDTSYKFEIRKEPKPLAYKRITIAEADPRIEDVNRWRARYQDNLDVLEANIRTAMDEKKPDRQLIATLVAAHTELVDAKVAAYKREKKTDLIEGTKLLNRLMLFPGYSEADRHESYVLHEAYLKEISPAPAYRTIFATEIWGNHGEFTAENVKRAMAGIEIAQKEPIPPAGLEEWKLYLQARFELLVKETYADEESDKIDREYLYELANEWSELVEEKYHITFDVPSTVKFFEGKVDLLEDKIAKTSDLQQQKTLQDIHYEVIKSGVEGALKAGITNAVEGAKHYMAVTKYASEERANLSRIVKASIDGYIGEARASLQARMEKPKSLDDALQAVRDARALEQELIKAKDAGYPLTAVKMDPAPLNQLKDKLGAYIKTRIKKTLAAFHDYHIRYEQTIRMMQALANRKADPTSEDIQFLFRTEQTQIQKLWGELYAEQQHLTTHLDKGTQDLDKVLDVFPELFNREAVATHILKSSVVKLAKLQDRAGQDLYMQLQKRSAGDRQAIIKNILPKVEALNELLQMLLRVSPNNEAVTKVQERVVHIIVEMQAM